jgi:hypothetical protein
LLSRLCFGVDGLARRLQGVAARFDDVARDVAA